MSSKRLKIAVNNHYREADAFIEALLSAGHQFVADEPADLLLIDLDPPLQGYQEMIRKHKAQGAKVFLFPHGAGAPVLSYDGLFAPDRRVDANLVMGSGHAEFLRRIDYPAPTHTIGWPYCPQRPFRPSDDVRHVVFGPSHPGGDGWLPDFYRNLNADVFAQLIRGPWRVTVRHIGTLEQNGLWEAEGVTYVDGRLMAETAEIDTADAVVAACGTYPALAIARGVPTVMYAQGTMALGVPGEKERRPRRGDRYMDFIRYPFDAADAPLADLIEAAARSETPIADWKRRFVGQPFDRRSFVALIERLVAAPAPAVTIDGTRRFTTLAFAEELVQRPELLTTYVDCIGAEDDATLLLWAPGLDGDALLATAELAIEKAGLDPERLPDVLLVPLPGSPEADLQLSKRADAVLSEWPAAGRIGKRPRFGVGSASALRAAAESAWASVLVG
jgi:hypothetical protein